MVCAPCATVVEVLEVVEATSGSTVGCGPADLPPLDEHAASVPNTNSNAAADRRIPVSPQPRSAVRRMPQVCDGPRRPPRGLTRRVRSYQYEDERRPQGAATFPFPGRER